MWNLKITMIKKVLLSYSDILIIINIDLKGLVIKDDNIIK